MLSVSRVTVIFSGALNVPACARRSHHHLARYANLDGGLPRSGRIALARGIADIELVAHRGILWAADPQRRAAVGDRHLRAIDVLRGDRQNLQPVAGIGRGLDHHLLAGSGSRLD